MQENKCGHDLPDHESTSYLSNKREAGVKFEYKVAFELLKDNSVKLLEFDERLEFDTKLPLYWTMIYDEGFEVSLHNLKLFHFNHYEKPNGKFVTNCAKTLMGWTYDRHSQKRGCSIGTNMNVKEIINKQLDKLIVVNGKVEHERRNSFMQLESKSSLASNMKIQQSLVDNINA